MHCFVVNRKRIHSKKSLDGIRTPGGNDNQERESEIDCCFKKFQYVCLYVRFLFIDEQENVSIISRIQEKEKNANFYQSRDWCHVFMGFSCVVYTPTGWG